MYKSFYRLLIFCLLLLLVTGWLLSRGNILHSDMTDLLPAQHRLNPAENDMLARTQAAQNRQVLLLVGGGDALQAAEKLRDQWQSSGLFSTLTLRQTADMSSLQADYRRLSYRALPPAQREQLVKQPEVYFQERAQALLNPFAAPALLPAAEDWAGFSRPGLSASPARWQLRADGILSVTDNGINWLLLRAQLHRDRGIIGNPQLLSLLQASENTAKDYHSQILVAGGAVFAAEGRLRGEREGQWMSLAGIVLTGLLAGGIFRRWRVMWMLLPVLAGAVAGLAATVAVFAGIHILSLVIATSLIGLLLDFPLHWLGKSIYPGWQAAQALAALRRPFFISMLITLLGYAFLLATDLPILRQTAVFTLAALPVAWGCTLWLLPVCFRCFQPRENPAFARGLQHILRGFQGLKQRHIVVVAVFFIAGGIIRMNGQDDIRQWVGVPQHWLHQAQRVAQLSGVEPALQLFLLHAPTQEALLKQDQQLQQALTAAKKRGLIQDYHALSRWLWRQQEQKHFAAILQQLAQTPAKWQALSALGIPASAVEQALQNAAAAPLLSPEQMLATLPGAAWRDLYLGQGADGNYYAAVRLFGVKDSAALATLARPGVRYVDSRRDLNRLFTRTRNQALLLKLASYAGALLILLAAAFPWQSVVKIMAVPLGAALCSVAVLGWLGIPLSLFVAFALLLISAVGMDYAVYAQSGSVPAKYCFAGMLPAALTTICTFGILGFSSTPAVAAFGISVALGIFFSLLLASWLLPAPLQQKKC